MTLPAKPSPNALTARSDAFAPWWDYAQQTARSLWTGEPIPAIGVYGPVLDAEEAPCLSAEATYSRFAPGDDRHTVLSFAVFARPAIMASALAVQGIVNHRRKAVARRAAVPAWRGTRDVHVILTSERLLANTSAGWFSFWHDAVTEFYVDLYQRWHWASATNARRSSSPAPAYRLSASGPHTASTATHGALAQQAPTDLKLLKVDVGAARR
jgi:hypothetical protein